MLSHSLESREQDGLLSPVLRERKRDRLSPASCDWERERLVFLLASASRVCDRVVEWECVRLVFLLVLASAPASRDWDRDRDRGRLVFSPAASSATMGKEPRVGIDK